MRLGAPQRRALLRHPGGWIAIGFGSGLSPLVPGTVGSACALLPWLVLRELPLATYLLVVLAAFVLGVWACDRAEKILGAADHGALVWDEFVGQWLSLAPLLVLAAPWWGVPLGFVLFRGFDIVKPWPIRWAERRLGGGLGVMADDLLAGAASAAVLWAILRFV